jgi:hypothetical protein
MTDTVIIACAGVGREVKAIIKRHGWDADFQAIDAKLHMQPQLIGRAVEARLQSVDGQYERKVVVYGHCGAFDLDEILARYGAIRPLGPHCFEMYGAEAFAEALREEPGSYLLTDFLVRAWDSLVVKGFKFDVYPKLKPLVFKHYRRLVYFSQEEDERLIAKAQEIAEWLEMPLTIKHVGYGDLERRLVAIMSGAEQPTAGMTHDGYSMPYPTISPSQRPAAGE